jgi:hypothetical protein
MCLNRLVILVYFLKQILPAIRESLARYLNYSHLVIAILMWGAPFYSELTEWRDPAY